MKDVVGDFFWRDLRDFLSLILGEGGPNKKKWKNGGLKISHIFAGGFLLNIFCENPVFFEIRYGPNKK